MRTIFEESWSEIDHRVRYPRQTVSQLAVFLTIFNRLAGSADEMGTFTKMLDAYVREQAESAEESARQIQQKESDLQKSVSQLKISEKEKVKLQKLIAELKTNQPNVGSLLEPLPITSFNVGIGPSVLNSLASMHIPVSMLNRYVAPNVLSSLSGVAQCTACGKQFKSSPGVFSSPAPICPDCSKKPGSTHSSKDPNAK